MSARWPRRLALSLGLLLAFGTGWASPSGTCLTVEIAGPIELPDGSIHSARSLTLCMTRVFSPVARLHLVFLDGLPFGLLMSRLGVSEGPGPKEPMVMFRREAAGPLRLVGYAWPRGNRSQTFLLQTPKPRKPATDPATVLSRGGPPDFQGSAVFLAPRAD